MARTGSETEQGPGRVLISAAAALAPTFGGSTVAAAEEPSDRPPTWRVHDVQGATLGAQHKGIGFFPTILGNSTADYLLDPARCPTATDKVSIPSADSSEPSCIRRFGVAY